MAGTTTKSRDTAGHDHSVLRDLAIQHNKLVVDVELLRATLVAHGAVAHAAVAGADAANLTGAQVGNDLGTPITS